MQPDPSQTTPARFADDFHLPNDISLGGQMTDAAIDLLCRGGVELLSLNTLAKAAIYSPSRFHARVGGKAGMLELLVAYFADRWDRRIRRTVYLEEDFVWLPCSPGAIDAARVWPAIAEIAHAEARAGRNKPAEILAEVDRDELDFLAWNAHRGLGRVLSEEEVLLLQMTLHGLRAAMAAPAEPLSWRRARAVLDCLLVKLGGVPLPDPEARPDVKTE